MSVAPFPGTPAGAEALEVAQAERDRQLELKYAGTTPHGRQIIRMRLYALQKALRQAESSVLEEGDQTGSQNQAEDQKSGAPVTSQSSPLVPADQTQRAARSGARQRARAGGQTPWQGRANPTRPPLESASHNPRLIKPPRGTAWWSLCRFWGFLAGPA